MANVDVIIITKNEERNLSHCLSSLKGWCNNTFIIDSGSSDQTEHIADNYGATFLSHPWEGFSEQRNWALSNASLESDWILILDADEQVPQSLREEIIAIVSQPVSDVSQNGFYINRLTYFMGKPIKHCGYFPSWHLRLFKRGCGHYESRTVHEHLLIEDPKGKLGGVLIHEDKRSIEYFCKKHRKYAELEARQIFLEQIGTVSRSEDANVSIITRRRRRLKRLFMAHIPFAGLRRFLFMYIIRFGFLDGAVGLKFCIHISNYDHVVALKLKSLIRSNKQSTCHAESQSYNSTSSLLFVYTSGPGFSGQQAATRMAIEGLKSKGYIVTEGCTPSFNREKWSFLMLPLFGVIMLTAWITILLRSRTAEAICLNHGQTAVSLIREGLIFRCLAMLNPIKRRILSLHGNVFMTWQPGDKIAKRFCRSLDSAQTITVLGPNQKKHLSLLGVSNNRTVVLSNTTDIPMIAKTDLADKFSPILNREPIQILYLSNLIASKGYITLLESLSILCQDANCPKISAKIVGPLRYSEYSDNFSSLNEAREHLLDAIETINQSKAIYVEWIDGAYGNEKIQLFRRAHLFVFPSSYPVEAQPIVLLEAMASGCAILTSDVGEIPFTMNGIEGVVSNLDAPKLASEIRALVTDNDQLRRRGFASTELFSKRYSYPSHIACWENIIEN